MIKVLLMLKEKLSLKCTHLYRVHAIVACAGWHVETDLHERHLSIIILVELQSDLILTRGALGNASEGDLKSRAVTHLK